MMPHYPVARTIACILAVIGAVIAIFAPSVEVKWLWTLVFSVLAAMALS